MLIVSYSNFVYGSKTLQKLQSRRKSSFSANTQSRQIVNVYAETSQELLATYDQLAGLRNFADWNFLQSFDGARFRNPESICVNPNTCYTHVLARCFAMVFRRETNINDIYFIAKRFDIIKNLLLCFLFSFFLFFFFFFFFFWTAERFDELCKFYEANVMNVYKMCNPIAYALFIQYGVPRGREIARPYIAPTRQIVHIWKFCKWTCFGTNVASFNCNLAGWHAGRNGRKISVVWGRFNSFLVNLATGGWRERERQIYSRSGSSRTYLRRRFEHPRETRTSVNLTADLTRDTTFPRCALMVFEKFNLYLGYRMH